MSSEDMGLVPDQRIENGLNSPLVFQDDPLRFNCGPAQRRVGDPGPKPRDLGGFVDDKMFAMERDRFFAAQGTDFRRNIFGDCSGRRDPPNARNWGGNGGAATPSGDESDDDEDDDEDDDDEDDEDGEVEGLVGVGDGSKRNLNAINDVNNNNGNGGGNLPGVSNGKAQHHSPYVSGRELLGKDGDIGQLVHNNASGTDEDHHRERLGKSQNSVTVAETDCEDYYSHYLQGTEGSASGQKVMVDDNGCGFSGRKDVMYSSESGESLRAILSDPVTGALMDDAMILPCGHSFGGGGIQHVIRMKACFTCSQPTSEESISPNLSLRAAVQAYRREEESQFYRSSKRRRERFDQGGFGDSAAMEPPRSRGVQFPFAVMDRVIIKGNKRTPQRFVGREAIVTTQCLNGWYVVKTLDNAESVKLQYRSLAKVLDDPSKPASNKMGPNWL
ncbi:U-box domain-containing protein 62 [Gastrolobium bilobum]|uniref:U-box domain-containing protein 62 n=1 Tax=Gastrolobium bilobum TaxID=150636 RepID=UPI002AB2FB20|nr:U-box domain-containing protein 62 [Gastrolobium bilobum]